jgi:hypothetical protein
MVFGLFYFVQCPPVSSVLVQMTRLHFFYGWVIFHCAYALHFLYLLMCPQWSPRLVHVLALVSSATVNVAALWHASLSSFGYKPRSGTAGHMGA